MSLRDLNVVEWDQRALGDEYRVLAKDVVEDLQAEQQADQLKSEQGSK